MYYGVCIKSCVSFGITPYYLARLPPMLNLCNREEQAKK